MQQHLYLSLMPEALIASMLAPEEFGSYYSVGSEHKTQGQAAFIEIDPAFRHPFFPLDEAFARCVPHKDGAPKRSVYVSVYRVLEHVPLAALGRLWLVTKDGRGLALSRAAVPPADEAGLHLYHELAPVRPLVVSPKGPRAFFDLLMGGAGPSLSFPAIAFVELKLGELATDPERGAAGDLPYENLEHLRSCLASLKTKDVGAKVIDRLHPGTFSYRMLKDGVYVGNKAEGLARYALPSPEALRDEHYAWWRSANM
ncbi:MAG: hypothetical protein JNG85_06315 [Spirochaetaceae bacterium]|nr:hypothetical protein [Spirochaetaceae bacterium]